MASTATINIEINGQKATQTIGSLNNSINSTVKSTENLKTQLRAMTQEMQGLDPTSKRFKDLAIQAGQLRDTIKDTNAVINATAGSPMENLAGGFTKLGGIGINAFQGIAGAQALFGNDSEELMKLMAKLQGAMALGEAIKGLGGLKDTMTEVKAAFAAATVNSNLFNKANIAQAVSTGTATIAQKAMNAVMNANPVFLIVTGITALVGAYALFGGETEDLNKKQGELNETFNKQSEITKNLNKNLQDLRNTYTKGDVLKTQNALIKAEDELTDVLRNRPNEYGAILAATKKVNDLNIQLAKDEAKARKDSFDEEIRVNQDRLTILNNQNYDAGEEGKKQREKDFAEAEEIRTFLTNSIQESRNIEQEGINNILKAQIDAENKVADIRKKINDERDAASKKLEDERKQSYLDYIATEEEKLVIAKNNKERELQITYNSSNKSKKDKENLDKAIEALEIQHQKNMDKIRLDAEVRSRKEAVIKAETEINNLKVKLAKQSGLEYITTAIQIHEKEKELLDLQMAAELVSVGENEDEKNRIRSEYANKRVQLEKDWKDKSIEVNKEATDEVDKLWSEKLASWVDKNSEVISNITDVVSQSMDLIGQVYDEMNTRAEASLKQRYDNESEAIKSQLANRLITENEYNAQIKRLEDKKRQEERIIKQKEFQREKRLAIAQAIMNTATAVMGAAPVIPLMIAMGVLGAAQIGIVSSQQFTAARGGVVPGNGPSHIDSVNALLAPGEMVINSKSSAMFPELLSEINQAGGGIPLAPKSTSTSMSGDSSVTTTQSISVDVNASVIESSMTSVQGRVARIKRSRNAFTQN